jgi:protein-L-isoaspartate(D-aspartate) O-methyltransferase
MRGTDKMLRDIAAEVRYTRHLTGRVSLSARVLEAVAAVPRHEFVGPGMVPFAYDNGPLPIGHGQTISQPFIVALMTDLLEPEPDHVVLEIGTGSGYQAAVLAGLVQRVYTVEVVEPLATQARERLQRLGYANVEGRVGDGYFGWPEHAPYDGVIVTAAAPYIPPALVEQLAPGGRLVIPLGEAYGAQDLVLLSKDGSGAVRQTSVLSVVFVPLTGPHHPP